MSKRQIYKDTTHAISLSCTLLQDKITGYNECQIHPCRRIYIKNPSGTLHSVFNYLRNIKEYHKKYDF